MHGGVGATIAIPVGAAHAHGFAAGETGLDPFDDDYDPGFVQFHVHSLSQTWKAGQWKHDAINRDDCVYARGDEDGRRRSVRRQGVLPGRLLWQR